MLQICGIKYFDDTKNLNWYKKQNIWLVGSLRRRFIRGILLFVVLLTVHFCFGDSRLIILVTDGCQLILPARPASGNEQSAHYEYARVKFSPLSSVLIPP